MKINIPVRLKNPWFWVGILGVVLTAMGVSPDMLTSWDAVAAAFRELVGNPYMLGSVIMALLGNTVDPTTYGIGDSDLAMSYSEPYKK